ncbi:bifunctional helix-turn-helix transcriptional regulator/GNAT family N-acetyltransferase [Chitinophaga filiformis]|uniref:Bifunctional helix-turn-helix transcriptional regulator/GNAT family N-acetyltransferase n=1 Tax=Chitinophaga filiformis TaxID=104663 RepID=A0ABY4HUL6_CHIFI|nr:bifunctional helix-turn-helix transcriptional regulator/GNAT family N-acetyltransferase [Chitinophaga filiformis]UPK67153.1 bifunctional helix-turn-helix transcriptional regulator/GNAT family N-acetyltransferase [Chitinophaga filiformis]
MSVNPEVVREVSEFNNYYNSLAELLNRHLADNNLSLSALRVLVKLREEEDQCTAGRLIANLGIDGGYLSRILKTFETNQLISKRKSTMDGRTWYLQLTPKGRKLLEILEEGSAQQISQLLEPLGTEQQLALAGAMKTVRHILSDDARISADDITYRRDLQPGDAGFIMHMHGSLYAKEAGYNLEYETHICKTFYEFLEAYNSSKDQVFLAMHGNQIIGSIAVLGHSRYATQMRWFLVHPDYRGLGIGQRLLTEAINAAKEKLFQKIYLITTAQQVAATTLFKKNGFRKSGEKHMPMWGLQLTEERYEIDLI